MHTAFRGILFLAISGVANSAVLTFDDVSVTTGIDYIYDGYGGFDWDNGAGVNHDIRVINSTNPSYVGTGYANGTVSGDYVAWNYAAKTPVQIDLVGLGTFEFNGAYFTSAWSDQQISFEGYNDGSLVYSSSSYSLNTTDPLWIELNWSEIDSLVISSGAESQWAMDNFTSTIVPIPAAVWLFGTGLGLLGWMRRKQTV